MNDDPLPGLFIREAREDDIAEIVAMFAADKDGGHQDTTDREALPDYLRAFKRIAKSSNDTLYVAELDGEVIGTFQTTLVTSINRRGGTCLTIAAVQTRADRRGKGVGRRMMRFAIELASEAGASVVQLTSNKARSDAHRFYERLGFVESHAGFKMKLR